MTIHLVVIREQAVERAKKEADPFGMTDKSTKDTGESSSGAMAA
jgi:hypothetical protein